MSVIAETQIIGEFVAAAREITEEDWSDVTRDTPISVFEFDSLDLLELVTQLESQLSMRISDIDIDGIETVGDFCERVVRTQEPAGEAA